MFPTIAEVARELRIELPVDLPKKCLKLRILTNTQLRSTLGYFKVEKGVAWIELNPRLVKDPMIYKRTFLHELAHAWAWFSGYKNEGHGGIWRYYMERLGISPDRLAHDADHVIQRNQPIPAKRIGHCNACGDIIYGQRRLNQYKIYRHNDCGGQIIV